jgi:hypothetical protein
MSTSPAHALTPTPLPNLPFPNCGANLLAEGFYNSCTETQRLREDNYTHVVNGKLYIDHDEDNYETVDHECDLEAFCGGCSTLLPWALYQIRELDGASLPDVPAVIVELLSELDGETPAANA